MIERFTMLDAPSEETTSALVKSYIKHAHSNDGDDLKDKVRFIRKLTKHLGMNDYYIEIGTMMMIETTEIPKLGRFTVNCVCYKPENSERPKYFIWREGEFSSTNKGMLFSSLIANMANDKPSREDISNSRMGKTDGNFIGLMTVGVEMRRTVGVQVFTLKDLEERGYITVAKNNTNEEGE